MAQKKSIKTIMQLSDYAGNYKDPYDCPGARAFKRACQQRLPWYRRLFMRYHWVDRYNDLLGLATWIAVDSNDQPVRMMSNTHVGQVITFKRIKDY